ncbi:hypothetical protein [Mycobacterium sp. 1274761.0]|uniref:hypothetical protein n=1 Tax=Mycobacterium sp. 1274761.0 TaxID=1834077 RepID=UPI00080191C5|nr:hypothetical protein [Mycobacterium sp. 1274761.0]OBK76298.1 hypothetical protein A5651_06745 [Mycobacterium sp. 1274761.0]
MTATEVRIERRELPPIPNIGANVVDMIDPYAVVTAGHIVGKVERYCYWHPNDEHPLDVVYEATIDGLPDTSGTAQVLMNQPESLRQLAAVCAQVALLLEEAKTRSDLVRGFFLSGNQTDMSGV